MSIKMKMKKYNFPQEEIKPRALVTYLTISIWVMNREFSKPSFYEILIKPLPKRLRNFLKPSFFYDGVMRPLSKRFKRSANRAKLEGRLKESRELEIISKKFHRSLGTLGMRESEEIIIFLSWLFSHKLIELLEDRRTASQFSQKLRKVLLKEKGFSITQLSEEDIQLRKERLREYEELADWVKESRLNLPDIVWLPEDDIYLSKKEYKEHIDQNTFKSGEAWRTFTRNLAQAIIFENINGKKNYSRFIFSDEYRWVIPVSVILSACWPLIVFIQKGIDLVEKSVLDSDINLMKETIKGISRACKEDLNKIYEI